MNKNLSVEVSHVNDERRAALLKQQGCVLWLTGLSGSGKSTVALALEKELVEQGRLAFVLDGDNVRRRLNQDLGFSEKDRLENLRRIAEVSSLMADAGVICITSFISPLREARQKAKEIIGSARFFEVYLSAPLETCEHRDKKGLYKKARAGEITDFTGVDSPFEAPENPDLILDSSKASVNESVELLEKLLRDRTVIS